MNNENQLKSVKVHSALNKPNLLLGGERELMLIVGLFSAIMVFIAMTWQTLIIGVGMWIILSMLLRMMAKADPMMSKIYLRQLKYKDFYLSHSTPFYEEK
jgi:type IV secretion system protein VirB3